MVERRGLGRTGPGGRPRQGCPGPPWAPCPPGCSGPQGRPWRRGGKTRPSPRRAHLPAADRLPRDTSDTDKVDQPGGGPHGEKGLRFVGHQIQFRFLFSGGYFAAAMTLPATAFERAVRGGCCWSSAATADKNSRPTWLPHWPTCTVTSAIPSHAAPRGVCGERGEGGGSRQWGSAVPAPTHCSAGASSLPYFEGERRGLAVSGRYQRCGPITIKRGLFHTKRL